MLLIDFETQSPCPIGKGNDNYCSDPGTNILCMSYGLSGGEPALWTEGQLPQDIIDYLEAGGLIGASNAPFDKGIWEFIGVPEHGFPELEPEQWYCTQAQSRVAGLPSALDASARATEVEQKLSTGKALIGKCCIPPYSTDPQDYIDLGVYCLQDWVVMDAVYQVTPKLMQHMHEDWLVNEKINERGIRIDRELAVAATGYAEQERSEIAARLHDITDGDVEKPTQYQRFTKWMLFMLEEGLCDEAIKLTERHVNGEVKHSSDKTSRANLLADPEALGLPAKLVKALQCMDDAGGSATAKFGKMVKLASDDDRVRGAIRCFGAASTHRYSSLGLQVHNFRRDAFTPEEAEHYRAEMLAGSVLFDPLTAKDVPVMDTLGRLLRSAIIPADGNKLVVNDWSAVESRMTAWLAGDERKLDLFRKGGDPYVYAAEGIYPGQEIDKPKRQVGKVTDLACGFLGGPGALASMASQYRLYIPETERDQIVEKWRANHPEIVKLGDKLQGMAIKAMKSVGQWQDAGPVQYLFTGQDLYCKLPDGKSMLRYPFAKIEMTEAPWGDLVPSITALKAALKPKVGEPWPRHALWRGLLLENVAQACCALLLRDVVYEFQDTCIFHVHDEVVLDVPDAEAASWAAELKEAMETPPEWAPDLPLVAIPEIMTRYGK